MCLFLDKWFKPFDGFRGGNALAAVVQVNEDVSVVTHSQFLHVGYILIAGFSWNRIGLPFP